MKNNEMLRRIRDVYRRIAMDQVHKTKSLFWAKLHYLLTRAVERDKGEAK